MLKRFLLIAVLAISLTLLIAEVTFASPLPEETQAPKPAKSESPEVVKIPGDAPVNQKPTVDDSQSQIPSSHEEKTEVSAPRLTYSTPSHPYKREVIQKFDEELYGEGN